MQLFERFNLGHGFRKYFEVVPATDEPLRHAVYGIRHEVYCEELKFEPERPNRMETDEFDRHSLHCLIRGSQAPHTLVGCTRLVLTNPDDPVAPLPFERTCEHTIDRKLIDPAKLPRDRIAEVSRLAVRASYRRRKGDDRAPVAISNEDFGEGDRPRFPYIPIGLYLGAVALAARSGIETLFVLTEPRLASHFGKLGVDIKQIGGPVEHRGTRVPSMMHVPSIIRNMRFIVKPIWRVVQEEIERGFETPIAYQRHNTKD
ncbi:PEP-CTERM/exosortase system-associated acyltransferase [Azoarcus communis]|uniref:PEP-CTERM/exosortase system-associated acyltransferase n=1 Tax=Parazoarcus communis SWub3 = DSM 12120 TaxID=1121029 RepID=A0A323UVW8_9RHOO|nr:PEP-CTERM/exosortase system-associated acyltransferase [Parazoarcus communis]NMG46768.1 PEP-CTERM/exosortase system-associated acyltransferase [Parazoarcus communis]NMG69874.1 PEP-CTERM/exosortase system-associated acyltransferase [Parazoarcus communis SWub3 = DSM 12120]PZA16679.1 PEP-CTERM/exosortase system-associated acyltransferase [Azoarcus communis] [Parazoarcus communis SWub3 = DSM 12120]